MSSDINKANKDQVFLFLQGPLSSFYSDIAAELLAEGHHVIKVHFCGNDVMDWAHPGALWFYLPPEQWEAFLEKEITPMGITHVVMHGDRRFYHQVASRWAKRHGVQVVATELGYLRPDWMTAEAGACSTLSHFPTDPGVLRKIASENPAFKPEKVYADSKLSLIAQELRFTFFNLLLRWQFPHYCSHRSVGPMKVYSGWVLGQLRNKIGGKKNEDRFQTLLQAGHSYFVFALQLEGDFQLRDHSPFHSVLDAIRFVLRSFAENTPAESRLLLKAHPHEFRPHRLVKDVAMIAEELRISERVVLMNGLSIRALCEKAAGFVTINSSAGFEALEVGCPTLSVMPTIYDCDGLTFQGTIDAFWREKEKPDASLFDALRHALAATTQMRGTLYHPVGRKAAARAIAEKLSNNAINQPDGFVKNPPRLEKAARMGVTYEPIGDVEHKRGQER